jgi:hypothetical protein
VLTLCGVCVGAAIINVHSKRLYTLMSPNGRDHGMERARLREAAISAPWMHRRE